MIKITKTCFLVLLAGIIGALFSQTTAGNYLEEEVGLSWLFHLRGELPAPADIIIVSLDQPSTEILHLPDNPDDWSRTFYVTLLEKLNQQEPTLIAFNIHFGNSREPEKDALLADAIKQNKNVLLSNYLKEIKISSPSGGENIYSERIIEPIPQLSQAALDTAPFLVPKTSSTVKQFWTFKENAGDIATFPVSVFKLFALKQAYPEMMQLLNQLAPDAFNVFPASFDDLVEAKKAHSLVRTVHSLFNKDLATLQKFEHLLTTANYSSQVNKLLNAWLNLFKEDDRLYLNYYGDVGAITTVPFYQVITPKGVSPNLFRNKIVLVGYADNLEPEKQQGFYSVFSKPNAKVVSPIEIAATAVANIQNQSWLRPLPENERIFLILVWGAFLSVLFRYFSFRLAFIVALTSVAYYLVSCWYLFSTHYIWMPLVIPLMQAVLIILAEAVIRYLRIKKISGYYLPKEVFAIGKLYPEEMKSYSVAREGVCMATDAGQYTSLAELLHPLELHKLMNDYYAAIFPIVKKHGGVISDVVGDAMLAIWAKSMADEKLKISVCNAALEIKSAIDEFNNKNSYNLETRIGLHYGEMQLGNVGAMEHYEFRAVGDTVNTASRVEGLNKLLGTRLLVSRQVIDRIPGFFYRDVGTFLLKGKTNPVDVFELVADMPIMASTQSNISAELFHYFSQAISHFRERQWQEALNLFCHIEKTYPGDGPTYFYINYLQHHMPSLKKINKDTSNTHAVVVDSGNIHTALHNI